MRYDALKYVIVSTLKDLAKFGSYIILFAIPLFVFYTIGVEFLGMEKERAQVVTCLLISPLFALYLMLRYRYEEYIKRSKKK